MTVPSYDDLTPGIPDMAETRLAQQLSMWLRPVNAATPQLRNAQATVDDQLLPPKAQGPTANLFACLRTAGGRLEPLLAVAKDFSPRIMRVSDQEVVLDVSGLGALIGEPPVIATELARALREAGADATVAIAPTQTMARLAACRPPRSAVADTIVDLPVHLLQPLETLPPAMNHRDRARPYETFERWGIATLGDLAALPAAALSSRLGHRGVALQRLARGLDPAPFVPDGETPRYIGRLELEWPIAALEPLSFVFARLLDPLATALERADRGAVAIRLELRLTDRSTHARLLPLPAPMRDPRVLRTLLLLDLESGPLFGVASEVMIDIVTIELDPAPARITQFSLLRRALPSLETLSTLTARLSALVGESRVGSPMLVDTHQPGAFEMRRYAPESAGRADAAERAKGANGAKGAKGTQGAGAEGAGGAGARGAEGASARGAEGAGANGAGLPRRSGEAAEAGALVLRRQRIPPAVRVRVEHGRPVYLAAARRGMPQGAIVLAAGPWRSSGKWWGTSWNRDEWDVEIASGAVCRILQDRTTQCWFLEGLYD